MRGALHALTGFAVAASVCLLLIVNVLGDRVDTLERQVAELRSAASTQRVADANGERLTADLDKRITLLEDLCLERKLCVVVP